MRTWYLWVVIIQPATLTLFLHLHHPRYTAQICRRIYPCRNFCFLEELSEGIISAINLLPAIITLAYIPAGTGHMPKLPSDHVTAVYKFLQGNPLMNFVSTFKVFGL